MKTTILAISIMFFFKLGLAQEKAIDFIPILFDTVNVDPQFKRKRLEIKDTLLCDSLRIGYKVSLEFEYPLCDTTKDINVRSVKLVSLDVLSLKTGNQYLLDTLLNNDWSEFKKDIWNRYSKIFNHWYRNQPYEKMINRLSYGSKFYIGGVLYAFP